MNSNTYLADKVAKQSKRIDKLSREVSELTSLVNKFVSDDFQGYLDKAISDGVANYEIKELMGYE